MILRDFFDKLKPNFSKGGRFEKLSSTFEAFESFAFTPNTVTGGDAVSKGDIIVGVVRCACLSGNRKNG